MRTRLQRSYCRWCQSRTGDRVMRHHPIRPRHAQRLQPNHRQGHLARGHRSRHNSSTSLWYHLPSLSRRVCHQEKRQWTKPDRDGPCGCLCPHVSIKSIALSEEKKISSGKHTYLGIVIPSVHSGPGSRDILANDKLPTLGIQGDTGNLIIHLDALQLIHSA